MKIVITGHASGIGKSLLATFSTNGHECIGYDILGGHDLRYDESIQEVLESCRNADVFINNALPNQSRLLQEVHNLWLGENKVIINLSSAVTYFYNKQNLPKEFDGYYEHKQQLNDICKQLTNHRKPYIMNVRPSWVNTHLVEDVYEIKIEPQDLASLIYFHVVNREKYQVIDIVVR
jgi:nucleoside-diphosphate-sugar epimerase